MGCSADQPSSVEPRNSPAKEFFDVAAERSLGAVLLRRTLILTLFLGLSAAVVTTWVDLNREKAAVEALATNFLTSAVPSAAAAAFNFDQEAAEQVARGLFLQRAVVGVTILNEGQVMVDSAREVPPTLPLIGVAEEVVLTQALYPPGADDQGESIGEMSITVDRSLVAPEIADRLVTFFLVNTAKNVVFGLLLYALIFRVLARHITNLAMEVSVWNPGQGRISAPVPPDLLRRTEVEGLGRNFEKLTETASWAIRDIQASHDIVVDSNTVLTRRSEELSDAVRNRTFELEEATKRLKRMAEYDGLTGLLNRASFDRLLARAFDGRGGSERHLAILLIDVDHFKAYNDFFGHQGGDDALCRIASILTTVAEKTGCTVARYGGEEFAAIVEGPADTPARVAGMIHSVLEDTAIEHLHSTVARRVTVSIGIASTAEGAEFSSQEMLVSAADDALYKAKQKGRNRTTASTQKIRDQARQQRLSMRALMEAIEAREFEPYGQPQVDARTGAVTGVEVLVRWVRPDGTVVPPGAFMQLATDTGLIAKIDAIVLEKSRAFLVDHPGALPRLSLNVTGQGFENEKYVAGIADLARSSTTGITIELLETAFIDRPSEHFLWQLDLLREAGVEIEIDDFGTGRTSILGLTSINPDRLKIARELILPLGVRSTQVNLVTSVIEIARSLDVDVLAEGIETDEVAQLLIEIGCPIQQGYFHGKPMPLESLIPDRASKPRGLASG